MTVPQVEISEMSSHQDFSFEQTMAFLHEDFPLVGRVNVALVDWRLIKQLISRLEFYRDLFSHTSTPEKSFRNQLRIFEKVWNDELKRSQRRSIEEKQAVLETIRATRFSATCTELRKNVEQALQQLRTGDLVDSLSVTAANVQSRADEMELGSSAANVQSRADEMELDSSAAIVQSRPDEMELGSDSESLKALVLERDTLKRQRDTLQKTVRQVKEELKVTQELMKHLQNVGDFDELAEDGDEFSALAAPLIKQVATLAIALENEQVKSRAMRRGCKRLKQQETFLKETVKKSCKSVLKLELSVQKGLLQRNNMAKKVTRAKSSLLRASFRFNASNNAIKKQTKVLKRFNATLQKALDKVTKDKDVIASVLEKDRLARQKLRAMQVAQGNKPSKGASIESFYENGRYTDR
jgi:hypothetical protein